MLGNYLRQTFTDCELTTLGLDMRNDIVADLRVDDGALNCLCANSFDGIVHAAGSDVEQESMSVNRAGTQRLLDALGDNVPKWMIFISCYSVYSRDAGCDIEEDYPTWATDKLGQSKQLAEQMLTQWAEKKGVRLLILRPAHMFGSGVGGEMAELFDDVISGRYIHIRDNDALMSLVTALDVARVAREMAGLTGVYNVSDGYEHRLLDLVEAMSENAGTHKRMSHLPLPWAKTIYKFLRFVPGVKRQLSPEIIERRSKSFTLNTTRLKEACGIEMHNTLKVISRDDTDYPYQD